jgi:hypothetical protein
MRATTTRYEHGNAADEMSVMLEGLQIAVIRFVPNAFLFALMCFVWAIAFTLVLR